MVTADLQRPEVSADAALWRDIVFTSRDGLRLYARHYPATEPAQRRPGRLPRRLTRNSRDFHDLAAALAGPGPWSRDVYTLDYRGRGRSDDDPDWRNYTPYFEMLDVLDFLALAGACTTRPSSAPRAAASSP